LHKFAWRCVLLLILTSTVPVPARHAATHKHGGGAAIGWTELGHCMENMQVAMTAVKPSGDNDVDFVSMMLPHHQAAIDMAKTELMYGKDPQLHRLAQEIITDQQSEIELMQLWLKQHQPRLQK
jgi:uncharacterized protein (DUF305 family)